MTVFLCGFMGCGKTTVGAALSEILSQPVTDMDEYIVEKAGKTIPEIFSVYGEKRFRELEHEAIGELCTRKGIIACGGGTMLNDDNARIASEYGRVVFIKQPFEVCYERIKDDSNRPLVVNNTKEQLREIFDARSAVYEKNSDICLDMGRRQDDSPEMTAREIIRLLEDTGAL